jgi:hypothetical protein
MKKIVASVGLVAVGASGLQAGLLPGMTAESGKPFTLSATLRGFYDDNVSTVPNGAALPPGYKRYSAGFEISPSIEFNFPLEQTTLSLGYVFDFKYYENKPVNNTGNYDMSHDFHGAINHAFSERYNLSIRDGFVIGQEPDLLRAGNTYTTFQRYSGNNIRNFGSIDFSAQLTPEFGLDLGYANTLYMYADDTPTSVTGTPSNAALLNENDNVVHLDGRYTLQPQTIGIVGFQFRDTLYTGDQPIGIYNTGEYEMSDARNARMYYGYLGLDHTFRPDLTGSIRGGGFYTEYYNSLANQNQVSPYASLSLKYTYLPESSIQVGGSYDYNPSSASAGVNQSNNEINTSTMAGTIFAAVSHRIMPKLYGGLMAQYQNSIYKGGTIDGKSAQYYVVGLNLRYQFTPNFSAEAGYNYDNVFDQVQGHFDRNRVYVGITGSY